MKIAFRFLQLTSLVIILFGNEAQAQNRRDPNPPGFTLAHPAVAAVAAVQDRQTPGLLKLSGVVGTATGLDANGQPVIRVFTEAPGVPGIPARLENVPVEIKVTGAFHALDVFDYEFPRPVPIGVSVGHPSISAGTIGCRTLDAAGNHFILSNNHVLANQNEALVGAPDDPMDGDIILQPGPADGGTLTIDGIGWLYDFQEINFNSSDNIMDAAIAFVDAGDVDFGTPGTDGDDGYGVPSSTVLDAAVGLNVQKVGRTTGWTFGQISSINATITVCYGYQQRGRNYKCVKEATFVNQIVVTPGTFSGGGDSGSLVVTTVGNHPVGLLFAGSNVSTTISPIGPILSRFNVTIDDGISSEIPTGIISGYVMELGGNAIPGATVTTDSGRSTTTDVHGLYEFQLPEGDYTLTASASDFYPRTSGALAVTEEVTLIQDFELVSWPTISGTVSDADANPIGNATVTFSTDQSTSDAISAADGTYSIQLPAGYYGVTASAFGYEPASESVVLGDLALPLDFVLTAKTSGSLGAIVVPTGYEKLDAPDGYSGTIESALRLQEVYDAHEHFAAIGQPITLQSMAFRLDSNGETSSSANALANSNLSQTNLVAVSRSRVPAGSSDTPSDIDGETLDLIVRLSTTSAQPDRLDLRFSSNTGADEVEVFNGQLTINATGGGQTPPAFEIVVIFEQPFIYDPAKGNLLVDISNYSGTLGSGFVDAANDAFDGASRIFNSRPDSSRAKLADTGADVIRFEYTAATE